MLKHLLLALSSSLSVSLETTFVEPESNLTILPFTIYYYQKWTMARTDLVYLCPWWESGGVTCHKRLERHLTALRALFIFRESCWVLVLVVRVIRVIRVGGEVAQVGR
jgi:hypothetical protein